MQKKHTLNLEIDHFTWQEIGSMACRQDKTRSEVAAKILDDYIQKLSTKGELK